MNFLHHILNLSTDDPVLQMYYEQLSLPRENNWANECILLRKYYGITLSDKEIKEKSKEMYKTIIEVAVEKVAFEELTSEASNKSKLKLLKYEERSIQPYLV